MEVITDEIGNAYFNVNTEENIYTHAGDDLKLVRIISEGNFLGGDYVVNKYPKEPHIKGNTGRGWKKHLVFVEL